MRFYEDPKARALLDVCKALEEQGKPVTAKNVYEVVKGLDISRQEARESATKWQNGKRIPPMRRGDFDARK